MSLDVSFTKIARKIRKEDGPNYCCYTLCANVKIKIPRRSAMCIVTSSNCATEVRENHLQELCHKVRRTKYIMARTHCSELKR